MDVVCERCQTEYEFDDALVSERGTTVKCTNCGHQFKIYRPAAGSEPQSWTLRRRDGTTIPFDSLAVLQKWILEGRVTRNDQLSRNGEHFKALGSIAELDSFFASAEMRAATGSSTRPMGTSAPPPPPVIGKPRPSARPAPAAPPPPSSPSSGGTLRPAAVPPPARSAQPGAGVVGSVTTLPAVPPPARLPAHGTLHSAVVPPPAMTAPSQPLPTALQSPPPASSEGFTMGAVEPARPDDKFDFGDDTAIRESWVEGSDKRALAATAPASVARQAPATGPLPVARRPLSSAPPPARRRTEAEVSDTAVTTSQDFDDLGIVRKRRRPTSALVGTGIVLVLAGGGLAAWKLGAFGRSRPVAVATAPTDRVAETIARAEDAARSATRAGFAEASEQLNAALIAFPDEPRVRAARAALLALWGEQMRLRAEDLEARAALGGPDAATMRAEAAVVRRDARTNLERAQSDVAAAASAAVRVSSREDRVRFECALGEAARVLGDMTAAQRHLEAARASGGGPEVDLLAALLERDTGHPDMALDHLRPLASRPATAARAHLARARLLAARGDAASARADLDALLRDYTAHAESQELLQAINAGLPPFQRAAAAAPDAGAVAAAGDAGRAPATAGAGDSHSSGNPFAGRSYDSLVAEGERLQEAGQRERARQAFTAALAQRNGSEAITGLGYVELDAGNYAVAVSHFRQALAINSHYSDAYMGLGEAYARQGQREAALRAYREYLNVNPNGSRAAMVRNRIERLERESGGGSPQGASENATTVPAGTAGGGGHDSNEGGGSNSSGSGSTGASNSGSDHSSSGAPSGGGSGSGSSNSGGGNAPAEVPPGGT